MVRISILLFLLKLSPVLIAAEMNQYLSGQLEENTDYLQKENDEEENISPFVFDGAKKNNSQKNLNNKDKEDKEAPASHFLGDHPLNNQGLDRLVTEEEELKSSGQTLPGTFSNEKNLVEANYKDQFAKFDQGGHSAFNFAYLGDNFDYVDTNGVYRTTFKENPDAFSSGYLILGVDKFFYRGAVELFWGLDAGLSFKRAKGHFIDGATSDMYFSLWAVPIDLSVGLGLPLGRYLKLTVNGGPSIMGLLQTRSDKKSGEKYKRRRQVSYGYYGGLATKLAVSEIFKSSTQKMFSSYGVTKYFINFQLRYHSYQNFQDEIGISGLSFGGGFTFEYL